jgi:hypothetical protein
MEPSVSVPIVNQRVIQDRRSHPTSFLSTLRFGGRRNYFRREGEGRNQYVDRPSLRTVLLTFIILTLSTLDAILTIFHLKNGASELNPLMEQIIQGGFQSIFIIIKSLCVGLLACFLASHQNFKISFYGMHASATIYTALLAYHLKCSHLFQVI